MTLYLNSLAISAFITLLIAILTPCYRFLLRGNNIRWKDIILLSSLIMGVVTFIIGVSMAFIYPPTNWWVGAIILTGLMLPWPAIVAGQ